MCGFAGYIATDDSFLCDDTLLKKMHEEIAHRGPDGHGIWTSLKHKVALIHRRLSIIDLSDAGAQPMIDADSSVIISFNGEIYNYKVLKKELQKRGHVFITQTDTEVFLYAFKEWGIACLDKLDGMFAGVLGNLKTNEWYLFRDRMGVKPCYFSEKDGYLSFASEIKALWCLPWIQKKLSTRALYHYLTFMVSPAPLTLYKDIYKLPAGHYAKLDPQKNLTFHEWYNPLNAKKLYLEKEINDEQFCVERIRELLRESVKKRMMSDVPFGVFLSGGVDSSLNVALMSEFTDQVKTFNVSFSDGPEYSEVEWARKVSHQFGTDHHEIVISEKEAFQFYKKMVYHQDEPIADCVCIPLYYVSKLLKDSGTTVVQVGEGSDELFCGYQSYAQYIDTYNRYYKPTQFIPQSIKKTGAWFAGKLFPTKQYHLALLNQWASGQSLFWTGAFALSEKTKQELFLSLKEEGEDPILKKIYPEMNQKYDSYSIVEYHLQQLYKKQKNPEFLTSMIYSELKQRLPELLLMRVDKMTMATGVEARVPFLDHTFVEFALQIPMHLKYKNGITKYILKKASEGILPNDVIYRKKMGFAAPTARWIKEHNYFGSYFEESLQKQGGHTNLNLHLLSQFFTDTKKGKQDYSLPLWVVNNVLETGVV